MKISTKRIDDTIPVLTSKDQYCTLLSGFKRATVLGMDTEMLLTNSSGKPWWPHLEGFPQERKMEIGKTSNASGLFDWHGDGYAFELCIEPIHCLEYVMARVGTALLWTNQRFLSKTNTSDVVNISAPAVYTVPDAVQKTAPNDVKRLGCMPSLNVYGDSGNPKKLGASERTTGCHLHITSGDLISSDKVAQSLVQWADTIVGCVWTYVSPEDPKKERLRREAYGRAGEYRARTYPKTIRQFEATGVEYRVLPGTVLINPVYMTLVFNLYRTALRYAVNHPNPSEEITDISRAAINGADKELAKTVINWLPFGKPALKLLNFLADNPTKALNTREWYDVSQNHGGHGHQYLAAELGYCGDGYCGDDDD